MWGRSHCGEWRHSGRITDGCTNDSSTIWAAASSKSDRASAIRHGSSSTIVSRSSRRTSSRITFASWSAALANARTSASHRTDSLSHTDADELLSSKVNTIVCMNVLEHIEDDHTTLSDFARVLQPGGHLVLLVPSMKALYGTLDKHLNHFRRYSVEELRAAVTAAGFEIETLRFLNRPAVLGWWLSSRVLKRRVMPKGQLKAFKWVMPLLRLEEKNRTRIRIVVARTRPPHVVSRASVSVISCQLSVQRQHSVL